MFKYCILIDKSYFLIYNSYMYNPKKSTEYLWEYQFVLGKYLTLVPNEMFYQIKIHEKIIVSFDKV